MKTIKIQYKPVVKTPKFDSHAEGHRHAWVSHCLPECLSLLTPVLHVYVRDVLQSLSNTASDWLAVPEHPLMEAPLLVLPGWRSLGTGNSRGCCGRWMGAVLLSPWSTRKPFPSHISFICWVPGLIPFCPTGQEVPAYLLAALLIARHEEADT